MMSFKQRMMRFKQRVVYFEQRTMSLEKERKTVEGSNEHTSGQGEILHITVNGPAAHSATLLEQQKYLQNIIDKISGCFPN